MYLSLKKQLITYLIGLTFLGCNNNSSIEVKSNAEGSADIIYFGGDIITMEGDSATYVEAVATKGDQIIFAGSKEDADKMKGDTTYMKDLQGKTMLPGFIDPHIHPSIAASILPVEIVSAMEWNTPSGKSIAVKDHVSFIKRLKEIDKSYDDPNKVLLAWGYFKPYHGNISRAELNTISKTRPIVIWQRSTHEFFLNDGALKHYKITEEDFKKSPGYGDYKRGHVFEAGLFTITQSILASLANPNQFKKGLELMTSVLHKGGLTTVCEQGFPQLDLNLELNLNGTEINKPTTPYRFLMVPNAMNLYPKYKSGEKVLAFCDSLIKTGSSKLDYVKAIKFYVDGAIFSQLMIMGEPYEDHHHGAWMMQPKEQEDVFKAFYKANWDIHIHVNGDGGLDTLLSIIDRAKAATPNSSSKIIMEHYGYARPDQHEKVAAAGIWVSNNPYYYFELSGPYAKEGLGLARASKISSVGSLEKLKVPLSFHSDYFMAPAEPLVLVWSAVNRINSNGDMLAPEEKVSLWTAMKAVTIEAAKSIQREKIIGTIAKGKKADFVLLDENPFKIDPKNIRDITIFSTVFEGKEFKLENNTKSGTAAVTTGTIKTADATIEYFKEGIGSPIVLLPGGSLNTIYLAPLAKELAATGHQVIRINPRGTGNSIGPANKVTLHDLGNDVAEVIKALKLGKVDIAGHAFGNRIARVVANDHPEMIRSIILLAAGGAVAPKPDAQKALDVVFNPSSSEKQIIGSMSYMVGDSNYYARTWDIVKQSRSPKAAGIQSLAMKSTPVTVWSAPAGNAPFLVLQGSNDQVAPPSNGELLKKQFPERVTLISINGAGHMMVVERAAETTTAIINFISSIK